MTGLLRLFWMKYPGGHEVREHPRDEDQGRYGGLWIVPRAIRGFDVRARSSGGSNELLQFWATREEFEVGLGQHDIYIDLANAPCTPDGAIDFADRWGLLSKGPFEPWFGLNRFYDLVITMRGRWIRERRAAKRAQRECLRRIFLFRSWAFAILEVCENSPSKRTPALFWRALNGRAQISPECTLQQTRSGNFVC